MTQRERVIIKKAVNDLRILALCCRFAGKKEPEFKKAQKVLERILVPLKRLR